MADFIAIEVGYDGVKRVYPGDPVTLDTDKTPSWCLTPEEYAKREAGLKKKAKAERNAAVTKDDDGNLPGQAPQKPKAEKPAAQEAPAKAKEKPAFNAAGFLEGHANTVIKNLREGSFDAGALDAILKAENDRESPRPSVISQIDELRGAGSPAAKSPEELADG